MTQYNILNVKLSNSQVRNLFITLKLSSSFVGVCIVEANFPQIIII